MTRLLFWIALVILVVAAVRSKLRAALTRAQGSATAPGAGPLHSSAAGASADPVWRQVEDKAEPMACCARCGIYFPSSEAVRAGGRDYCSPAHAHPDAG
jgi:uncharacterized protein